MKPLTEELLKWNEAGQKQGVEVALAQNDTSLIVAGESNVGWLHIEDSARFDLLGPPISFAIVAKSRHRNSHCAGT